MSGKDRNRVTTVHGKSHIWFDQLAREKSKSEGGSVKPSNHGYELQTHELDGRGRERSNAMSASRMARKTGSPNKQKMFKAGYRQPHRVKRYFAKDMSELITELHKLPRHGNCMIELDPINIEPETFKTLIDYFFQVMKSRKEASGLEAAGLKLNYKGEVWLDNVLRVLKQHAEDYRDSVDFNWAKVWVHSHITKNRKTAIYQILEEYPGVTVSFEWRKGTIRRVEVLKDMESFVDDFEEQKAEHHLNFEIPVKIVYAEYGKLYDFLKKHQIATVTITSDQLTTSDHNWLINHIYRESVFLHVNLIKPDEQQPTDLRKWIENLKIETQWRGQIVCGSRVISTADWLPVCLRTRSECAIVNRMWSQSQRIGHRIGLYNGWLMSKYEYPPPYVLSGRFYKQGQVDFTIYIRCTGIAYPPESTNKPHSGVACSMGESSFCIQTHNLMDNDVKEEWNLGHSAGYNFRIIDRGLGVPIVFEVERTGEDGIGDSHPRKVKLQAGMHTDPLYWHNYIVLAANSDKKDGFVMIDHLSILYDKNPREREDMRKVMSRANRHSLRKKYNDSVKRGVKPKRGKQYKNL